MSAVFETELASWRAMAELPEVVELRRRRRLVTNVFCSLTAVLFTFFLVAFIGYPQQLGEHSFLSIPLSFWVVFSQFAGTWVLVYFYFRLSRTYLQPAADDAIRVVTNGRVGIDNKERIA
ncbi:DUF485 domain-containing protein [Nocardia sp. 348MFTsu5.1]|uniref:DUF485 domain-containing protein n=1 Tax=Nocardia sp. 348MFTsu5.1 TaxID=1172185 RepID=UPI00036D3E53|nr:DUF485 domain-containing protein [Nocardia sp. 348MFTsu5.1]